MYEVGRQRLQYVVEFVPGAKVRIAQRDILEEFLRSWKYHHKLELQQLAYAGQSAEVQDHGIYHGGDVIYSLKNVPGIWHQHLLWPVTQE